ncbi:MAG: GAF domain-containing protein [Cyanobacteria bacterium P01_E01_bin.35]
MSPASRLEPLKHQDLEQILQSTVQSANKILQCDRVIIYDVSDLPQARVVAESVQAPAQSLLGQEINDPFLAGDYLEMYCYGMSLTIDDIHTADVNKQDLYDLEKLGINSVAVAPIYVEERLLAFLVAHQSSTQAWDLQAVDLLAEQASSAGKAMANLEQTKENLGFSFTQQIAEIYDYYKTVRAEKQMEPEVAVNAPVAPPIEPPKQQETLIQKTRARLFAALVKQISQAQKPENIFQPSVDKTRQLIDCDRVLIYLLDQANYGEVIAESVAVGWTKVKSKSQQAPQQITQYIEEDRNGKVRAWNNSDHEDAPPWYRQQLDAFNVKAGLVAPIAHEGQLFGLLVAHQCSQNRNWQEQEINWITQVANHLGTMLEQTNGKQQQPQLADVQQQLQQERMWTKYFANVIQTIRSSLHTKDILKNTVQQIHPILKCDRVLIYTLTQNSYGKIVAESVSPGWTKAEGRIIKDPCFEARYLEKYRDGRFRAWNNIHQSGMSDCYIEQLERLDVKANLVVPIIKEQQLFGLLVVQQCSNYRQWQQSEILWLTQIATQVGFALDNAQLLADAQRLRQQAEAERKWTEYFTEAVQQIRQSQKTKEIYRTSVREVRQVLNCDRVLVYSLNQDRYGTIVAESVAAGWTRGEGRVINDPCFEVRYLDKYRDGRVRVWNDIYQSNLSDCYIEQLERLEVKANLVVPIVSGGKLFGLLVAQQCAATRQWQQSEINWLTKIATQVSFALENAQIQEQLEQQTKITQSILERAALNSDQIQRAVHNVAQGLSNLADSCDRLGSTVDNVKDLGKQLTQHALGLTRVVNLAPVDQHQHNSVVELSEQIFSVMQELLEATAKIKALFAGIQGEIAQNTATLTLQTQSLVEGVSDFPTASQNLEQIMGLNQELSNLIKQTSSSLETQIQGSNFAQDSVQELTQITERISQQSLAMIKIFNHLGRIIA